MGGFAFTSDTRGGETTTRTAAAAITLPPRAAPIGLTADGECSTGAAAGSPPPSAIAEGITECELVTLKGAKPTDVLIGESGKGQRETQVLYAEPGGREIYMFTDNRLSRIVKPGQG
ncbi:hypothetical protein IP69_03280 [Bosea sp. AAP35]|nr:hypothetical protein IP69_03280 [Bosea sp. AAP35]